MKKDEKGWKCEGWQGMKRDEREWKENIKLGCLVGMKDSVKDENFELKK